MWNEDCLIGMDLKQAEETMTFLEIDYTFDSIDGKPCVTIYNLCPGRIRLNVVDGVITSFTKAKLNDSND